MRVTLIRHLPTEWNKKTWLQGKRDIGISLLTEEFTQGIDLNKALLNKLAPFDFVLASTLKRTQETAKLYGYEPETERLLDELDFGPFEGLPKEKLFEEHGELWVESPQDLVLGESLKDFEERIRQFLEKYQGVNNLLVFGHGSWIRAMLSYHKHGNINQMNKEIAANNECFTLTIP